MSNDEAMQYSTVEFILFLVETSTQRLELSSPNQDTALLAFVLVKLEA